MARKSPATASDEQRMALKVMAEGAFTAEAKHEGIAYLHASPDAKRALSIVPRQLDIVECKIRRSWLWVGGSRWLCDRKARNDGLRWLQANVESCSRGLYY